MKKTLSMILAGSMLLAALAGCGGGSSADTSSTDDSQSGGETSAAAFKIGGTAPLTGNVAIYGNAVKNGATIAVEEINAEGGDIQFDLEFQDDQGQPDLAANAYAALKDNGMQLSLLSVTTKPGEAIAPLHYEDRIFAITPSASSTAVIDGKDNVFQMCFTDPNQGTASADYIAEQNLGTNIGIIYQNDEVYSTGILEKFKEEAAVKGLNIVTEQSFTADTMTDFSVQLNACKSANVDLLFLPIYYTPASLILTQANTMGYTPKVFGVDGMDGILTVENFDTSLAEGVMLLTPFNADAEDEATKSFVAKYQEAYGEVPNQFAADAYDCVYAYKQALEQSGATPDMSAEELCDLMIEAFTSMTFDGLTGESVTWDTTGAVSKSPKGMVIENGAYVGM